MIKLEDFTQAIKVSWVRRYAVEATDDHWADIIDTELGLTPDTREEILEYGPERFNKIIKKKIPAISNMLASYKIFKSNFPNTIESNTSRCFSTKISQEKNHAIRHPHT